jgi:hypothetical protein
MAFCVIGSACAGAQNARSASANITGRDFDVLHDVIAAHWQYYKGPDDRLCLDPTVALYSPNASAPQERWADDVLARIAVDVRISLDTLTTAPAGGLAGCARTQSTWRVAYGRPRVFPDSAALVFISTRLDARQQVDSVKLDFRIKPKAGKWRVDGWLAETQVVHQYVKGDGCYRLWYRPAASSNQTRVDTTDLLAESKRVGQSWRSVPAYRLSTPGPAKGVAADKWKASVWYVTHDSIHFEWGGSWSAVYADLHVVGDSLRGNIRWETDAIVPNPPTSSIVGVRAPCGSMK